MNKKGDTLVEVALAVGIFSMVAIAVVAVMSNGTSGAQTALETTLAREEIDTQAEALRFIHSAYIANQDSTNNRFNVLWRNIIKRAVAVKSENEGQISSEDSFLNFVPTSCGELYAQESDGSGNSGEVLRKGAFVINPRTLGSFVVDNPNSITPSLTNNPLIVSNVQNGDGLNPQFAEASTYPRLIFGSADTSGPLSEDSGSLPTNLYRAEGLYIIAVKEQTSGALNAEPNFYDFYIRTCWYGTNAEEPSTISTVMRLYNPDINN